MNVFDQDQSEEEDESEEQIPSQQRRNRQPNPPRNMQANPSANHYYDYNKNQKANDLENMEGDEELKDEL